MRMLLMGSTRVFAVGAGEETGGAETGAAGRAAAATGATAAEAVRVLAAGGARVTAVLALAQV
jgi:hypothetical protein